MARSVDLINLCRVAREDFSRLRVQKLNGTIEHGHAEEAKNTGYATSLKCNQVGGYHDGLVKNIS